MKNRDSIATSISTIALVALSAAPAVAQTRAPSSTTPPSSPVAVTAPSADELRAQSTFESTLGIVLNRPNGVTSDRVAERAAATSFDVRARRADVMAAAAALDQAVVAFIPRVSLGARYARLSPITPPSLGNLVVADNQGAVTATTHLISVPFTFPVLLDQTTFQASVDVPISDYLFRSTQAYAAASHSRRAAELSVRASEAMASFNARIAWWNLVRARVSVLVADQAVLQAQQHLVDVQNLERAGAVSEADVVRVQSQDASSRLLALRARDLATVTEDQVRTAMHLPPGTPLDIGDDVRGDLVPLRDEHDFASLYEEALRQRPELMALAETVGSLHDQATVARAAGFPRLNAFADLVSANPNQRVFPPTPEFTTTWDVGVGLSWSPNDLGSSLAGARGVEAHAAQVDSQRMALRDQVRSEVMGAFAAVREAEEAIVASATGLSAAEESYRVRRVLFQNGRATSVELTDAETDLTRARLEALNARVDLRVARSRLNHATGRDAATR